MHYKTSLPKADSLLLWRRFCTFDVTFLLGFGWQLPNQMGSTGIDRMEISK